MLTIAPTRCHRPGRVWLVVALAVLGAAMAGPVHAADRIYWGDSSEDVISFANADGSGAGGDLATPGATMNCPWGTAIDLAAGRIYWTGCGGVSKISFASLDGTGGGDLNTTGATVNDPTGVTIDPGTGRLYWANRAGTTIGSFSGADGSAANLDTTGATIMAPSGVALDLATGRLYWGNGERDIPNPSNTIAFANVDGTGGATLDTTGAPVSDPSGVAIDAAARRIYWTNYGNDTIGFAALGGGSGGQLVTTGAMVSGPLGAAIDADAGLIYWGNYNGGKVSWARLDGTGGGNLDLTGATIPTSPSFPALVRSPGAASPPAVAGATEPGSVLTCAGATWLPDDIGAFLYRVPATVTYQWSRDGADVAGATASTYAALVAGEYRCTVTASNLAGDAAQASAPHTVVAPPEPPTACVVPNVVGQMQSMALATLEASGCSAGKVKRRRVSPDRADVVLAQRPKVGKTLALGAKVKLIVGRARRT